MINLKNKLFKITLLFVVLSAMVIAPVFSQQVEENAEEPGLYIGIPVFASYRAVFDQLANPGANPNDDIIRNIDIGATFQFLFPVGNSLSIGPEFGISFPVGWISTDNYINSTVFHIPIRLTLNSATNDFFSWDVFLGTEFNVSDLSHDSLVFDEDTQRFVNSSETIASTVELTFDVGARVYFGGFMIMAVYKLPVAIVIRDTLNLPGLWDNSVFFGLGYRFFSDI